MKLNEIHIRDPFILVYNGKYYMYGTRGCEVWGAGTGLDVYIGRDLEEWSEPLEVFTKPEEFWADLNYWAPEVYFYKERFYMFVSFKSVDRCRGTQILVSDSPEGPFLVHSEGPVTPESWECLDGTLYVSKEGVPYMVFCHEWVQVTDGEMWAVELTYDLKSAVGEPFLLFKASEPAWVNKNAKRFVTDGPFLHMTAEGGLLMIWSSFSDKGYAEAVAYSDNGEINGRWLHKSELLFADDGGHGMLFKTLDGVLMFAMHSPNKSPYERPILKKIYERGGELSIV